MRTWWQIVDVAETDPPRAIVQGLIAEEETVLLYGYSGTGKSLLALELALAIQRGQPFLGHYVTSRARVGILDEESPPRRLGERLRQLAASHGIAAGDPEMPLIEVAGGHRIDTPDGLGAIWELIRGGDLGVLIVDTLRRVHGLRENDSDDMARIAEAVAWLKRRARDELGRPLTIVLIHHAPKPREGGANAPETMARGSGDIFAAVDSALYARKVKVHDAAEGEVEEVVVEHAKARWGEATKPFRVRVTAEAGESVALTYMGDASDEVQQSAKAEQYVRDTLAAAGGAAVPRKRLIEDARASGLAQRTLLRVLSRLKELGTIEPIRDGRETLFRLTSDGLL
ncbi:MAG TPA: AAA family ATPase [Candidatus Limnocylindria bacterium]|nr:AAA family ATPase [Candidatus Limnocylindria bacterium]